jgi:CRISPR-associated Csx2 family protein
MAKILISPLGTGSLNPNNTALREYRTALYQFEGKQYQKSFISSVLYEHLELDGIIFIGTVKSMWEEVYRVFCEEKEVNFDENYYFNLVETIEQLNYQSDLDALDLKPIESILGEYSQCILIKYGINEQELKENFDHIIKIVDFLKDGDEIYIDITHSFRSLSLFMFLVLNFVNDLYEERRIKVKGVYYGMLDVTREFGFAPVVNLQSLFDVTEWIKGLYSLKSFGNGYLISDLLHNQGQVDLAKKIKELSDAININYLPDINKRSQLLQQSLQSTQLTSPFQYLKKILEQFVNRFAQTNELESQFQLKLAKWYFDNKRYATGYITLTEAIITYLCEIHHEDIVSQTAREQMKQWLRNNRSTELAQLYFKVNKIRRGIAHALIEGERQSYNTAISNAENYYQKLKLIFKKNTIF